MILGVAAGDAGVSLTRVTAQRRVYRGSEDAANQARYWQRCELAGVSVHDQA